MTAKYEPRITLEGRTKLETVIPLSTPFILFLDPSSCCNFRCTFCPTGNPSILKDTQRHTGLLDFKLYTKIIDDLNDFKQPLKVLRLYKDGEPFLNPRLADMVRYAKDSGNIQFIDTTTNGALLTPERVMPVIEAGIDQINISLDGMNNEQFLEFTRTKVDFDRYVKNIEFLYKHRGNCQILIKTVNELLTDDTRKLFLEIFSPIVDKIFIENVAPCWPDFNVESLMDVEITKGIYGQEIREVDACPYIFYQLAINPDGKASICFLDWGHNHIVGDTRTQSLKEIWESEAIFNYQSAFLRGERKQIEFCSDCKQLSHCLPDNIDPYKAVLLDKLLANRKERGNMKE